MKSKIIFAVLMIAVQFAAGCTSAKRAHARDAVIDSKLDFGGRARTYLLYVPATLDKSKPAPLVIMLHGGGGNAKHALKSTGFDAEAEKEHFIVAYPNGTGKAKDILLTWNAGNCCAFATENNVDDPGFIRAMIEKIEGNYNIDEKRIYAAGFSNGAMLTYTLACELSDVLAAAAPVAGINSFNECAASEPVSLIIYHGTNDQNVPYNGGVGKKALVKDNRKPVATSIAFWVDKYHCQLTPETSKSGNVTIDRYSGCDNGVEIEFHTIKDGGHAWPGGTRVFKLEDEPSAGIPATDEIWKFFAAHPKK